MRILSAYLSDPPIIIVNYLFTSLFPVIA